MKTKATLFSFIFLLLILAGCARDNPAVLDKISALGPFREFSEYETYEEEKTSKGTRWVPKRKIVIVVRKGLTKEELTTVSWTFNKAYPNAQIDFFDDDSGLNNYVNLDSHNPNVSNRSDATYDANFISKHRVATLSEGVNGEWHVSTEYKF